MNQEQQHEMKLVETYSSGVEQWHCPHCDRRMVMQWTPYKKLVLESGDDYALHSALKGDMQLGTPEVKSHSNSNDEPILSDELRNALDDFLRDMDFGD